MRIATMKKTGKALPFDLDNLLTTRLLIQASSGSGKSYAIRKLLEETHGKVQHIVLDLEGEFSSLREKYDYVLVGKGENVDVQIDIKSAELLAKKLLKLNVSTIIDLYELKHHERILFVKRFLDSMINAKKELWHPVIVVVDEAHIFCPEGKSGKAESAPSVIDLCTRGRKRGFAAVLCTQRIAKLNKDAAAELKNKMIGHCSLDIDMKRAAAEIGYTSQKDILKFREIDPGEFFCFGPALTRDITLAKIDKVSTTHPEAGQRIGFTPAPPTAKIKSMLAKLSDLPQKAETELKEKQDYIKKIRSLEVQLRISKSEKPRVKSFAPVKNEKEIFNRGFAKGEALGRSVANKQLIGYQRDTDREINRLKMAVEKLQAEVEILNKVRGLVKSGRPFKKIEMRPIQRITPNERKIEMRPTPIPSRNFGIKQTYGELDNSGLGKASKAIYKLLLDNPGRGFTKTQAGAILGYAPNAGHFQNSISVLTGRGLIKREGSRYFVDEIDPSIVEGLKSMEISLDFFKSKLGKAPKAILEFILENRETDKISIAEGTNYEPNTGHFQNSIGRLVSLNLIKRDGGMLILHPEIEELL